MSSLTHVDACRANEDSRDDRRLCLILTEIVGHPWMYFLEHCMHHVDQKQHELTFDRYLHGMTQESLNELNGRVILEGV